jgi:hypothetical protein
MKRLWTAIAGVALILGAAAVKADQPTTPLEVRAEALAGNLAAACPVAQYDDEASFEACGRALRAITLPFGKSIAWGGDQPEKQIKKKGLTHFNSQVFQTMYLPLFSFTGRWSVDEDKRSHTPIIRVEAYFRNALPADDFPYPFWHSADKWNAYEAANELRFYLDANSQAFIVTRGAAGSETRRGRYAHVNTPVFDGTWQWRDAGGNQQPRVSLFGARYSQANPILPDLDKSYQSFALRIRDESCLNCHTPANLASSDRLVLLQTPRHAAGEIDDVINAIRSGEMPQDDIGLRKDLPVERRTAILNAAVSFREKLELADQWEAAHPPAPLSVPSHIY